MKIAALLFSPILLSLSMSAFAKSEAAKAYQEYLSAVESEEQQQVLQAAQRAYDLGRIEYGKDSLNTAKLALNLANHTKSGKEATKLLKPVLKIFKQHYGESAIELLDVYLALQKNSHHRSANYHEEFTLISASHYGETSYEHGQMLKTLANAMTFSNPRQGYRYAQEALDLISQKAQGKTVQRAEAEFLNGVYAQGLKKTNTAIEHFETVVDLFKELDYSHPYALAAHSRLVPLLEKKNRSDEATAHCLAIGQMTPWQENIEASPLYRIDPEFPLSVLKKGQGGAVTLEISVDKQGFVTIDDVIDNQGPKAYVNATKKAVKQWRYAPKFENGAPVEAKTTVRLDFKINKL